MTLQYRRPRLLWQLDIDFMCDDRRSSTSGASRRPSAPFFSIIFWRCTERREDGDLAACGSDTAEGAVCNNMRLSERRESESGYLVYSSSLFWRAGVGCGFHFLVSRSEGKFNVRNHSILKQTYPQSICMAPSFSSLRNMNIHDGRPWEDARLILVVEGCSNRSRMEVGCK